MFDDRRYINSMGWKRSRGGWGIDHWFESTVEGGCRLQMAYGAGWWGIARLLFYLSGLAPVPHRLLAADCNGTEWSSRSLSREQSSDLWVPLLTVVSLLFKTAACTNSAIEISSCPVVGQPVTLSPRRKTCLLTCCTRTQCVTVSSSRIPVWPLGR